MNKITIILDGAKNAGNVDEIKKDFNIYQKSKQSILLNVLVPKSLIGGEVSKQYFDSNGMMVTESGTYTALKMGVVSIDDYGKLTKTENYYLRYLKDIKTQNGEFYLYERMLPNEFTLVAGVGFNAPKLVFNVVNILNNISFDEQGKTIVNDPTIVSLITTQMCRLDILPSTNLDQDQPVQATELELLNAEVDMLIQKIGNKIGADNAVLKFNLNEELPANIVFNKDGYKTAGVMFLNVNFEIPSLDYKTETKTGSIIVTNVRNGNGKTLQTEAFFYDDAVSQRVLELDEKFAVSSVGEWSVKVDRKQSKEHVGEFLYVDKKGNINFTKALKDFITKSNDEVISEDTSSYEFSEDFKAVAKNKEEIRIELSDEAKNLLSNANSLASELAVSIDPDTYIMKVALLNTKGDEISSEIVDLPLESMIIDGRYENGYIYLQLQSGTEINFSIASLISGLVPTTRKINGRTLDKDIEIPIPTKLSELSEKDYNSLDNLPIIPEGVEVIDNLESERIDASASANMARVLNEKINKVEETAIGDENGMSLILINPALPQGVSERALYSKMVANEEFYFSYIEVYSDPFNIYRYKPGQSAWEVVSKIDIPSFKKPVALISNATKRRLMLVMGWRVFGSDLPNEYYIFTSDDNGVTWEEKSTINLDKYGLEGTLSLSNFFCNGSDIWALGLWNHLTKKQNWIISYDGGNTWGDCNVLPEIPSNAGIKFYENKVFVVDLNKILVSDLATTTEIPFVVPDRYYIHNVCFYDGVYYISLRPIYLNSESEWKVYKSEDLINFEEDNNIFPNSAGFMDADLTTTGLTALSCRNNKIYLLYVSKGKKIKDATIVMTTSDKRLILDRKSYICRNCYFSQSHNKLFMPINGVKGLNKEVSQSQNKISEIAKDLNNFYDVSENKIKVNDIDLNGRDIKKIFFSLGDSQPIPANADLNEYKQSGNYACKTGDETISTIKNKPSEVTSVFTMKVYSSNGGASGSYPIQEITTFNLQRYIRRFNNDSNNGSGAWTEWYKIMTDKEINSKYYSVGPSQIIPVNADLNNYTLPGNYAVYNADFVESIKNKPEGVNHIFYIRNIAINGMASTNYISQELTSFLQQKFVRTYNGDNKPDGTKYGWTQWKEVLVSDGGELGGVKIKGYEKAGASTPANTIFIATPTYNVLSPSTATDEYFQQLLGWICKNYPNMENCLFVGQAQPNSTGLFQIQIYDTSNTQSTIINGKHLDLPQYSSGFYVGLGGVFRIFGTSGYSWNYRSV